MGIGWLRLCGLYRKSKGLLLLLVLVPFFCTVLIMFSAGSIINLSMSRDEDNHKMVAMFSLEKRAEFDSLVAVIERIYEIVPQGVIPYFSLISHTTLSEEVDNPMFADSVSVEFRGKIYHEEVYPYMEKLPGDFSEGGVFSQEEFASDQPYVIVRHILGDSILVNNSKLRVVGRIQQNENFDARFPWMMTNVAAMRLFPISSVQIGLRRSLTSGEFENICDAFHQAGYEYKVVYSGESEADEKAIMKTIECVCGTFLVILEYVLLLLYQYSLTRRMRQLAVFRLLGCTRGRMFRLIIVEQLVLFLPAAFLGGFSYFLLVKSGLGKIQRYLSSEHAIDALCCIFALLILIIIIEVAAISVFYGRLTVHRQFLRSRR